MKNKGSELHVKYRLRSTTAKTIQTTNSDQSKRKVVCTIMQKIEVEKEIKVEREEPSPQPSGH